MCVFIFIDRNQVLSLHHEGGAKGVGVVGHNSASAAHLIMMIIIIMITMMIIIMIIMMIIIMMIMMMITMMPTSTDSTPPSTQPLPSRGDESMAHCGVAWNCFCYNYHIIIITIMIMIITSIIAMIMIIVSIMIMIMIMACRHIPTMTKSHHGGEMSVMIKVGICQ